MKMLGIVQWASGSPENFQGTHMYGALRGHLCDSTAFLFKLTIAFFHPKIYSYFLEASSPLALPPVYHFFAATGINVVSVKPLIVTH